MEILSISGLTKRYPAFTLDGVSFDVHPGEIMGLIGRNGAGKSTTLKCMTGFVHPDAGEISFFGLPYAGNEKAIRARIAFAAGGVNYYMRKKLATIADVTRSFYQDSWDEAAYRRYLTQFALDERKTPSQLSSGMQVKFNLALAMSHHAELLILDEPTSGLDPISRDDLMDVFLALQREGVSILFSTHITADLEKCADRITYIHQGKVRACESLADFAGKYRLVAFDQAPDAQTAPLLIGRKPAKVGETALILAGDAARLGLSCQAATLDDVMIHLEREYDR